MNRLSEEAFVLLKNLATWRENGYPAPGGKVSSKMIIFPKIDLIDELQEPGLILPEIEMSANIEPVRIIVGYRLTEQGNIALANNGILNLSNRD